MTLRFKMILGIGAILFVVILAYAIIALQSQARYLQDLSRHEADLIAAVADRALARAMGQGETEVVQAILRRIGEHAVLTGIRIVDDSGKILRSNRPEEIGRMLPPSERPRDGKPPEPIWDFQARIVGVYRPISNAPACSGCHPPNRATLGFLNVEVSFPAFDSDVTQQWTFMILAAMAALVIAGGLIAILFTVLMGRRIDALSRTMREVEAGDLSARIAEETPDELGRLGKSFNTMVSRLAEARHQLEDRHAQEIRRAQNLAALGQMAAGIAHEINNPIAGMQNCVRTLLKGAKNEAQRVQYLVMLREGLERIGRTVGQLLNFARESKLQLTETRLPPLLDHCLTLLSHDLSTRQISPSVNLDGDLPVLVADPHQLEQVFLNVLKNALEAMPEGGSLTIQAGIESRDGGSFVKVSVADTGAGIAPENLSRIFDPFFTTKDVGMGTGLGLSVSYGIIRAHGGFIDVHSEVGKGTTVTVSLPVNGK